MIFYKCETCGLLANEIFKRCPSCGVECKTTKESYYKLENRLKKIDDYFKNLSIDEFDNLLERNGLE